MRDLKQPIFIKSDKITKKSLDDVKAELNTWLESNYDKEIKIIEFEKVDSEFIFIIYHYIKKEK